MLGRWGSASVEKYVRDASTTTSAALARAPRLSSSLRQITAEPVNSTFQIVDFQSTVSKAIASLEGTIRDSLRQELLDVLSRRTARSWAASSQPGAPRASSASSHSSSSSSEQNLVVNSPSGSATTRPALPTSVPEPAGGAWVLNVGSGVCHLVLIGPPGIPTQAWSSYCGWKFGDAPHSFTSEPQSRVCRRCVRRLGNL